MHDTSFALVSDALDAELVEGGFLEVMAVEELGPVTAALVVERLARLPFAIETAFSALVRPLVDPTLPRPICIVGEGELRKPLRFLAPGASVIVVGPSAVRSFTAAESHVRSGGDEVLYGYPVAFLTGFPDEMRTHDADPTEVLRAWRVAVAAEMAGLLAAALQSVVTYTSERKPVRPAARHVPGAAPASRRIAGGDQRRLLAGAEGSGEWRGPGTRRWRWAMRRTRPSASPTITTSSSARWA